MIEPLAATREMARRAAVEREERRQAGKRRRRRIARLALFLAVLAALLWSAWRIGYETALIRTLHP